MVFSNGITLDQVTIVNDPNISYPMSEAEKYVSFTLIAEDGKPLNESKRVYGSLVSTSFNNGFKLKEANVARGDLGYTGKPYQGMEWGDKTPGPPVLYARAGAVITAKPLAGMTWTAVDWHFKPVLSGTIGADGVLTIPADKPIFSLELTR